VEIWIKSNELAEGKIRGNEGRSCESGKKMMDTDKIQGEYGESIYSILATIKSIPN
jgi:hypothetical protein